MKLNSNLLALCVVHSAIWGTSAFLPASNSQKATTKVRLDPNGIAADVVLDKAYNDYSNIGGRGFREPYRGFEDRGGYPVRYGGNDYRYDSGYGNSFERRNYLDQYGRRGAYGQTGYGSNIQELQGGSLKTWSFGSSRVERVQVVLATEGRPLNADVELWQGPDNTPVKMKVYGENGARQPFKCFIETPRGPNTVAIRNTAQLELPIACKVDPDQGYTPLPRSGIPQTVQGGALRTFAFDPDVRSVQVLLKTDGRPLNARIELLQGPNNNKQVIDLHVQDGYDRPFAAVIETPGSGNVVRIVNTAPVEFPLSAWVEPYSFGYSEDDDYYPENQMNSYSNSYSSNRNWF